MHKLLLTLIKCLHMIFVMFVVIVPFSNSNYLTCVHCIIIPFVLIHWVLNNNICALTVLEKYVGKMVYGDAYDTVECFTCRLIEPVYDVAKNHKAYIRFLYLSMISLWIIGTCNLIYKYRKGEINGMLDLLKF